MEQIAIIQAFAELPDARRRAGMRHNQTLCLALFTLAIAAGNKGFLAMGDWLKAYQEELLVMFKPYKNRLPSYSTIRRVMLKTDIEKYGECLSKFFEIKPERGETIAVDGKLLKGSYMSETDNPCSESHPSIMLVSAYIVERGLILPPYEVERKTNEIKALPEMIEKLALKGVVFAFDAISTQKKLVS